MGGFFYSRGEVYCIADLLSYPKQIEHKSGAQVWRTTPVHPRPFAFRAAAQPVQSAIEKIFDRDDYRTEAKEKTWRFVTMYS
jgi:hypothetical protein